MTTTEPAVLIWQDVFNTPCVIERSRGDRVYDRIFYHEDEDEGGSIEVLTLDDSTFALSEPDTEEQGRLLFAVPKGSAALRLRAIAELRDRLSQHLLQHPEPTPIPAPVPA